VDQLPTDGRCRVEAMVAGIDASRLKLSVDTLLTFTRSPAAVEGAYADLRRRQPSILK